MTELAESGMTMIVVTHEMGLRKMLQTGFYFLMKAKLLKREHLTIFLKNPKKKEQSYF